VTGYGVVAQEGAVLTSLSASSFEEIDGTPVRIPAQLIEVILNDSVFDEFTNTVNAVEVAGGSITSSAGGGEFSWGELGGDVPYLITSDLTIDNDISIAPGVNLQFAADTALIVETSAKFVTIENVDHPITMKGTTAQAGHWKGIHFKSSDSDNQVKNLEIAHAGAEGLTTNGPTTIFVDGSTNANLTIETSTLSDGAGHGIYVSQGATINDAETFNDFTNIGADNGGSYQNVYVE
jgi:hypothetical protein